MGAALFARQDYVEEAWRIVDPVLKTSMPVYEYEKGAWMRSAIYRSNSNPGS
jgi:glucose-6-phosphate 1-dehydrogenase